MTSNRYVTLGTGRQVSLSAYVAAWRRVKAMKPDAVIRNGIQWFDQSAAEVLRQFRDGMHDRINRHLPGYGRGRRWAREYQVSLLRDCTAIRDYRQRRIVRSGSGLELPELQRRYPDVHERFRSREW